MRTGKLSSLVLASCIILSGILISASCKKDNNGGTTPLYHVSGNASGAQVVPAVGGAGTGTITGTYDPGSRTLNFTSTWTNLSGAPTNGGFFIGAAGSAGTTSGVSFTFGAGVTGTGTVSGSIMLTAGQEAAFVNSGWYYTYGTATNPNGEIRGQIIVTQ